MINYTVDTNSRPTVYFFIGAVALVTAFLAGPMLESTHARWLAPSAFSLFGLLLFWYERIGWRTQPIASWSGVPDLTGRYTGTVEFDRGTENHKCYDVNVAISQTWTKIDMVLNSGDTVSHLRTCGFFVANGMTPSLVYTYLVKSMEAPGDRSKYGEGTAEMYVSEVEGILRLTGRTYSTKERTAVVNLTRQGNAVGQRDK